MAVAARGRARPAGKARPSRGRRPPREPRADPPSDPPQAQQIGRLLPTQQRALGAGAAAPVLVPLEEDGIGSVLQDMAAARALMEEETPRTAVRNFVATAITSPALPPG